MNNQYQEFIEKVSMNCKRKRSQEEAHCGIEKARKNKWGIALVFFLCLWEYYLQKIRPPSPFLFYDKLEDVGDLKKVMQQCEFATTMSKSLNLCRWSFSNNNIHNKWRLQCLQTQKKKNLYSRRKKWRHHLQRFQH